MKFNFEPFAVAIALSLVSTAPAIAGYKPHFEYSQNFETWEYAGRSEKGSLSYVDVNTVQRNGSTAFFWHYSFYPDNMNAFDSALFFNSVDCKTRRMRQRYAAAYDKDGNLIGVDDPGDQGLILTIQSGTALDRVIGIACGYQKIE